MPTGTKTSFGQYQVAEPLENLALVHRYDGTTELKEVDHEPALGVLDQEDLVTQGINVAALLPGAPAGVTALGSCTANATTVGVSNLGLTLYRAYLAALSISPPSDDDTGVSLFADTVTGEKGAIVFYNKESSLTSTPYPPNDDGCTGPVLVQELINLKVISTQRLAHTVQDICSLLQTDGVLEGGPFLNAWMDAPANAIVDGNGSAHELEAQIRQGVAGGHETYISGIAKITLTETGLVVPEKTLFKVRNSWSKSWGDNGSFYIHASTLEAMFRYFDFRQIAA